MRVMLSPAWIVPTIGIPAAMFCSRAQPVRGHTGYAMLKIESLFQCTLQGRQPVAHKAKLRMAY